MDITRRFSFVSKGLPADTFSVVSFTGTEGLSRPYEFIIDLVSTKADLEMEDVIHDLSELRILRAKSDIRFQGVLARLEQLNAVNNYVFYRAVLVPRFWALKLTRHNRIFLDKSTPEILKEVLTESGLLSTVDVELRLMRDHPSREYVCQYRESNFDFISRWMEREGMYYFFEQGDRGEKLVITDTKESHTPMPGAPDLRYSQDKGLELASSEELAVTFICEQNMVPRTVMVKDYNYRKPTLELKAESNIAENGLGTVYVYGDNFKTSKEAKTQATVRAEEARTSQQLFKGTGTAPFLRPGFVFKLFNHFRNAFNSQYLTTEVEHHGDQSGYLLAGLGRVISSREAKNFYSNAFTAVPVETQFRPKRTTPLPRFYGIMNAVIDAEGSGDYAELDEQGRYKVRLPFDIADRPDGKASSWLRMAQPYGGGGHGMHFPLHKGTEVLLSFVDGDPDRPIIASAVPNFEQPSLVSDQNAPANAIKSAGGNQLVMGDKEGQEFMGMWSPYHSSGIFVGSVEEGGGGSISLSTDGKYDQFTAGSSNSITLGASNSITMGISNSIFVGVKSSFSAALETGYSLAAKMSYIKGPSVSLGDSSANLKTTSSIMGLEEVIISGGANIAMKHLITKAHVALAAGVAGTVAAGAGTVLAAAPFGDDFLSTATVEEKVASTVAGGTLVLAGGAMTLGAAAGAYAIVNKYQKMQAKTKTTVMKLNKDGMDISVNNQVNPATSSKISLKVNTNEDDTLNPKIQIMPDPRIEMQCNLTKLKMTQTDFCLKSEANAGAVKAEMNLKTDPWGEESAELVTKKSGYVSLAQEMISLGFSTVDAPTGGNALLEKDGLSLKSGKNALKISAQGIKLAYEGQQLKAGPLTINQAGIIQLGT